MTGAPTAWPAGAPSYDGGGTGCGELLLDLMLFARKHPASTVVLRATDPGAPMEIPAWCRLSGHTLTEAQPPFFLIQTKP